VTFPFTDYWCESAGGYELDRLGLLLALLAPLDWSRVDHELVAEFP
jgi:hypothetical protein